MYIHMESNCLKKTIFQNLVLKLQILNEIIVDVTKIIDIIED